MLTLYFKYGICIHLHFKYFDMYSFNGVLTMESNSQVYYADRMGTFVRKPIQRGREIRS